jgi:hypothetical protein
VFRLDLVIRMRRHADAADDQEAAEDVDDPVELLEQIGSGADHDAAHDERADDPPEQYAVLVLRRHAEIREHHHEHEDVVDRQRLLDQPACQELQGDVRTAHIVETGIERERECDPECAEPRRFPRPDLVRLAVKHEEVQCQQEQHQHVEQHPPH